MEIRIAKINLDDLKSELLKNPVPLVTDAREDVKAMLMQFNFYLEKQNYLESVRIGKQLLIRNLMPWAEESKFNLCLNIVRALGLAIPNLDREEMMMNLVQQNYNCINLAD